MKKIKVEEQQKFVQFVFNCEYLKETPKPETKLCNKFLKFFAKFEQPFNKEKYISGFNFLTSKATLEPSSPTIDSKPRDISQLRPRNRSLVRGNTIHK